IGDGKTDAAGAIKVDAEASTLPLPLLKQPQLFNPTSDTTEGKNTVDTVHDTLTLDEPQFKNGDEVLYRKGADSNAAIGGLVDDGHYFVRVDDNKLTLYDTKAHAQASGTLGKVDLTPGGTGSAHSLEHADGLVDLSSAGSGEGHRLTPTGFDLKVSAVSVG